MMFTVPLFQLETAVREWADGNKMDANLHLVFHKGWVGTEHLPGYSLWMNVFSDDGERFSVTGAFKTDLNEACRDFAERMREKSLGWGDELAFSPPSW